MAFVASFSVGSKRWPPLLTANQSLTCPTQKSFNTEALWAGSQVKRLQVQAKKGGGGSKRARKKPASSKSPSSSELKNLTSKTAPGSGSVANDQDNSTTPSSSYAGPVAPELLQSDGLISPPSASEAISDIEDNAPSKLPISDEAKLKLPELNVSRSGVRRKRKPVSSTRKPETKSGASANANNTVSESPSSSVSDKKNFSLKKVRELTTAYRLGEEGRQALIDELEKEPDFLFQATAESKEYDLTSAIFGTGKPNKQGIYVLPYLQSAHIVLLAISCLIAFVYYPGFPLTEASDDARSTIKITLAVVFVVNSVLAALAYRSAGRRGQPSWFWAAKTFVLGELAFGELRRNTKIIEDQESN